MRLFWLLQLLLVGLSCGQDDDPTLVSGSAGAAKADPATNATTEDKPRYPSPDQMLAQLPPVTAPNSGIPVMDAFYLMFPALSSLLRWGSLFPAQSILGAVPDTLTPAASKVVLVLADDANAHKSRVTRQNAPDPPAAAAPPAAPGLLGQIQALGQGLGQNLGQGLGQNLGQGLGQDLGQNLAQGLGQTLSQGLGQNLAQGLGQNLAQGLGQNLGQGLGQNLGQGLGQNLGQDLGQGLGQNLGQGLGQNLGQGLGQNLGQSIGQSLGQIVSQLPPPLGQGPLFPPIPGLLGQAAPPTPAPTTPAPPADDPPTDAQAAPPAAAAPPPSVGAPNPFAANPFAANPFAANPFMDTNLLGQALPPMPPMPAMPPVGQLPQPHELMAGLTQFWQGGQVAQASDISEVRVKPETITYRHPQPHAHPHAHHHAHEQHMEAKRAQLKIKSALQMQQEQQREQQQWETKDKMPLLWFRTPATDAQQEQTEQQGIHSKLLAFERQVISELKMLQQIESMARELRATAQGEAAPATYRLRYPLSRTPVHKITREDIERALRDDFVRRLLYKEAQRKAQQPDEHVANIKRQTQQPLSTEDMAKVMAYAYRMAQDAQNQEKEKQKIYAAYRAGSEQGTVAQVGVMGDEAKTRPPPSIVAPQQDAMTRFRAEAPGTLPTDPMTFQTPSMFMQPLQPRQMNPVGFQNGMFMQQPGQPAMMMQQPVQMSRGWAEANAMQAFQQQNPALQQQHRMDDLTRWQTEKMRAMQMQQHAERAHQQAQAELRRGKEIQQQAELADRKAQEEKVNAMQQAEQAERQIKENERDITDTADDLADPSVGEATPQIPPTPGQERHKGLGGHHKKHKSKSATPTIINYYSTPQVAPVAPQYAPQPVAPSSYGTSYGGGGYGSNAYAGVAYRAAIGNDEIDNMLREHRTLATINSDDPHQQMTPSSSTSTTTTTAAPATLTQHHQTTSDLNSSHRIEKSQSSASASASASASPAAPAPAPTFASASPAASPVAPPAAVNASTDEAPNVGAVLGISGDLLRPYMGLLPLEQPHDPWTEKRYDPHHALFTGGGSYEPYLPRPRRATHIMPSPSAAAAAHMLTPGMLERLLRIKNEFQRRFPHVYQGMLNHHTNQTRVVVKPPLLVQLPSSSSSSEGSEGNEGNAVRVDRGSGSGNSLRFKQNEPPVYELGAAERSLFDEQEEQEEEHEVPASGETRTTERSHEEAHEQKKRQRDQQRRLDDPIDREVDYFHFDDDDVDNVQQHHYYNDNDNDTDEPIDD